jgi:phosphoribulokinase
MIRDIPTPDESFVIIHFRKGAREKWDIDFRYLLSMVQDSFMSSPTSIVVNGGKMGFAMELILTPIIHRMIEDKQRFA